MKILWEHLLHNNNYMASWAQQRRFTYIAIFAILVVAIFGYFVFTILYTPPTCFDNKQNGREQGIDCGGSCVRLCQNDFLSPSVAWTSLEQFGEGLYNVATYIINPNTDVSASNVPYRIVLFDERGVQIVETTSMIYIPPHRNTLAFNMAVSTGKRIPYKALFEFIALPEWKKATDPLLSLQIRDKKYLEDERSSSLLVTLYNSSVYPIGRTSVYVILYDANGTTIGFSKTIVDGIPPQSSIDAPFTWSHSRSGKVVSIEVLPVAE